MAVAAMAPAHFFGRQAIDLVSGGDGGMRIARRQPSVSVKRLRHQRSGLRARSQRRGARGQSNGEFQKVAAFHGISPFARSQ